MFSHANLVLFNKNGRFFPLSQKSEITVAINDDFGSAALFYPIIGKNEFNQNIIMGYKKVKGGRFNVETDEETIVTKPCIVTLKNKSFRSTVVVRMQEINAGADKHISTITDITTDDNPSGFNIASEDLTFPSFTVSQNILFNKVSVGLHETEYFYVLAETKDSSGNITYKEVNEILSDDISALAWAERYKLLFFIDCRDQDNFRTFKVNNSNNSNWEENDEVIWSDRTEIDFTTDIIPRVDIAFRGDNEGVYEQTLYICLMDMQDPDFNTLGANIIPIGEIKMTAETVGEDERYRTLFENFGIPDPKEFDHVYKDSYTEDDKPDYISINNHSKEMFLSYDKIFPYVGTYKALFNAIKLLGYTDIFFKEWYRVLGVSGENSRGYVAYNMSYGNEGMKDIISALPLESRLNLRKKNWLSMMYNINKELYGAPDEYDFPYVKNIYEYRAEESLIKLISLKEWLEKYILALNCHITDIGGEGIYFERYNYAAYGGYQQNLSFDTEINVIPVISDVSANDKMVLKDSSSYIPVKVVVNTEEKTFNSLQNIRFADYCDGYIDSNDDFKYHSYSEAETDIPQDEKSVYIGTTFAGFNNRMTYSLNTVSTVENFIFDNSYFSEDSPRLMIRQNSISFISSDIVSKEKNTAFKKLPVIALERAIFRPFIESWEKSIKYTIYPENDPDTNVSYYIENKTTGEKAESADYIFLAPPTYRETDDNVEIISKNGISALHKKKKHYNYTSDFRNPVEEYITNDTTYGLRFSANNAYEIPLFSIQGYTVKKPVDFNIPVTEEYYLDIIKGMMIFNDDDHKRNIYILFDTDENGKRDIKVKFSYYTDEFNISEYTDGTNSFPYFIENNEYSDFANNYNNENDFIIYNLRHNIKVYNSGIFDVTLTARDIFGQVYCANTANKAEIMTEQPLMTAYTNNENSNNEFNRNGKQVESDDIKNMYESFCIFDYKPKNDVLKSVTQENNIITYPLYPYSNNTVAPDDIAHYMNFGDKFKIVAYDALIQNPDRLDWNYYFILNRQNRKPYTRITEKTDLSAIYDIYNDQTPSVTNCHDLFADASNNENLDVTVMFYNEAGAFPIIQVPGKIVNAKVLDNISGMNHYQQDEYHLLISEDITDCYYFEATDDYGNVLSISKDDIHYTAIVFEQNGVQWLLKSALSEGYGSLWEYDTLSPALNAVHTLNKNYAYSNLTYPLEIIDPETINPNYCHITTDGWNILETEDTPLGYLINPITSTPDFIHNINEDASVTFRIPAGMFNLNDPSMPRYRMYSDNNKDSVFSTYYAVRPKILMDRLPEFINDPNISVYVYPYWKNEINILGVDPENNRIAVQFIKDIFPRAFKKGEVVKMIWSTHSSSDETTQSAYKVIGYDMLGMTLILEGDISSKYVLKQEKNYAYADIRSNPEDTRIFTVNETGWRPEEYEDDGWVNGWLSINGKSTFTYEFIPENSQYYNTPEFPENSVRHSHEYRIPAGKYVDDNNNVHIRYRIFTHDDLHCTDTSCSAYEHGMFNPYYYAYVKSTDTSVYLSYAHNAFADYSMTVKESEILNTKTANVKHDKSYINDKLTYYIDDTFKMVNRNFDTNNGILYWMNSNNNIPNICNSSIYSYNCPVTVQGKTPNVVFDVDYDNHSKKQQTVLWKLYKSIDSNHKALLFESWNDTLFLDIEDKGIYDIELNTFDIYGNKASHLYEGAYTIADRYDEIKTYYVNCHSELIHGDGDYGYIKGNDGIYNKGDICILSAYVNTGYRFIGWYIGDTKISADNTIMFTVDADYNIIAKFDTPLHKITAVSNSAIMGDVSVLGGEYENGEYIGHYWGANCSIIAIPKEYQDNPEITYKFVKWTDMDSSENISSDMIYTFTVSGDKNFIANFTENTFTVTVVSNNINYGKVEGTGVINGGSDCTINAYNNENYVFDGWYENDYPLIDPESSSTYTSPTFTIHNVKRDYYITGKFKMIRPESCIVNLDFMNYNNQNNEFNLSVENYSHGTYGLYGEVVKLKCTPASTENYRFYGWYTQNGDLISTNADYSYTLRYESVNIYALIKTNQQNI